MDYYTLVERLLDGTITAAEKAELDQLRLDSPDIDREVRSLLEVEQFLRHKGEEESVRSLAFRESVRSNLKASLGLATPASTNAHAPTVSAAQKVGVFTGPMRLLLAALVVAGTGVGYLVFQNSDADVQPAPTPERQQVQQAPEIPQAAPALPDAVAPTGTSDDTRSANDEIPRATTPEGTHVEHESSTADNTAPREIEGTVTSSDKNKRYTALIQQALERLKGQEQMPAAAAVTSKQVALLYDKLGDATHARSYFDIARRHAKEASVPETEGEITAEYALFEARSGNKTTAETLAGEALRLLRSAQSTQLSAWEASLKQLTTR